MTKLPFAMYVPSPSWRLSKYYLLWAFD